MTNVRVPKGAKQLTMSFKEVFTARLLLKILIVSGCLWWSMEVMGGGP